MVAVTNTGCQTAVLYVDNEPTVYIPHNATTSLGGPAGTVFVFKVNGIEVGRYTTNCNNPTYSFNAGGCDPCAASPVVATVSGNLIICAGQTTALTASGGTTYRWSNGATTPSVTVGTGTYSVTATNASGCTGVTSVTVTQDNITANISGKTTVCSGQTTTLTASGGTMYKWNNNSTNASITVGVGTYTVTATNASGCTDIKSITVTQSGNITARISGSTTVCSGQTTTLTASGGASYKWSNGSTNASINVGTGTYTVTATNAGGCTGTKTVTVTQGGCSGTATFSATKCYRFNIRHSGKVMEVGGHSTVNGGNVQQWSWYGAKSQIWRIKDIGSGLYQIVNGNSGRVLDIAGVSTASGANVHQWQSLNTNNQKWKLTRNTEGYYVITAQHSGKALDVSGAGTQDGANIVQWTVHNGRNQQFQIAETTCPAGTAALQSAYILTAEGHRDGSKAVINWVSNANQQADYFVVEKLNDKAQDFEKLALVNAQYSLTDDKNFYSIIDNNPIEGENYYRIALYREGDTTPQYSGLVTLDFSHLTNYHLYPNPANDIVTIELEAVQNSEVTILITDLSGKIIQQTRFEAAPKSAQIAVNDISDGQYFIHIDAKNHRKVVKKLAIIR
jgi:hypothetical protein